MKRFVITCCVGFGVIVAGAVQTTVHKITQQKLLNKQVVAALR